MAAIDAGKHVYCEWPLGRNTDGAERLLNAAEQRGVRHAVLASSLVVEIRR
jgi:predicted dehydrogenase